MATPYDAIVIGAGANGLVTAAYLARAGQHVLALEQRPAVGGMGAREEFAPGFQFDGVPGGGWIPRPVIDHLGLTQHGLDLSTPDLTLFAPLPGGDHLLLWQDVGRSAESIRRFSARDAERWPAFCRFVARAAALLEGAYLTTPPDGLNISAGELPSLAGLGLQVRGLGGRAMMELIRVLPMSAWEFLDDWFESDALKGALAASAVTGIQQGPRSAGTAFVFLHHHVGAAEGAFRAARGSGAAAALAAAAQAHGVELRTGAQVARILTREGQATGVALTGGEEIAARRVISSADPSATFLRMIDPLELETDFVQAIRHIKYRGATAIINLALSELPEFTALPGDGDHLRGVIAISPDMTYLEKAYDAAKYGRISERPALEIVIPSLRDPSAAPTGQHVMTLRAQFAPYRLKDGEWDEAAHESLLNAALDVLEPYAPNVRSAVLHWQVISPADLEAAYGVTEGSLYHGEMTLDQLYFMRPVPGWAQYRTPVERLYLCGAGTHPGGGVTGASGYNAAREILKDIRRGR